MTGEKTKISSQEVKTILKVASATIRKQESENTELREKLAFFDRKARAEKIAAQMEEKGLNSDLSLQEKVASLMKAPNLDLTEEAVKLASVNRSFLGKLGENDGGGTQNSEAAFNQYILSGESPEA